MTKEILQLRKKNLWENIQELDNLLKDLKSDLIVASGLQKSQLKKQIQERENLKNEYTEEYNSIIKQLEELEGYTSASNANKSGSTNVIVQLNKVLAKLYSTRGSSERIAASAGIPISYIAFQDTPADNWYNILKVAQNHNGIKDIVNFALEENPKDQDLVEIKRILDAK